MRVQGAVLGAFPVSWRIGPFSAICLMKVGRFFAEKGNLRREADHVHRPVHALRHIHAERGWRPQQ